MFGIYGDVADRDGFRALKDTLPGDTAVGGLEEAAGPGSGVEKARVAGDTLDGGDPAAHGSGADTAPFETIQEFHGIVRQICGLCRGARDQPKEE